MFNKLRFAKLQSLARSGNNETSHPYIYRPLETPTTIRVLVLKPGTNDAPLRGELRHIEINLIDDATSDARVPTDPSESSTYEALSYVWGKGNPTSWIKLTEGSIPLMPNLRRALLRFRLLECPRILWIDGICINQTDLKERAVQVKLMGEVYKKAKQVLVWLGPDTARIAKRTFAQVGTSIELATGIETGNQESLETMRVLSQCEWFSRLWVVQELLLARQAIACWGQEEIEFDDLYLPLYTYHTTTNPGGSLWAGRIYAQARLYDFLDLLAWTSGLRCADEHDRVYALLGLPLYENTSLHERIRQIEPDYEQPVEKLFYTIGSMCVENHELNTLLSMVYHTSEILTPSWIPNWSSSSQCEPLPDLCRMPTSLLPSLQDPTTDPATHSLSLGGFVIDTVTFISDAFTTDSAVLDKFNTVSNFWLRHVSLSKFNIPDERYPLLDLCFLEALSHGIFATEFLDKDSLATAIFQNDGPEGEILDAMRSGPFNNVMIECLHMAAKSGGGIGKSKTHGTGGFGGIHTPTAPYLIWNGRRLFATSSGFFGLGPGAIQPGDSVVSFAGVSSPCIVRQREDSHLYVGMACIPLVYYEDGMRLWKERCGSPERFEIR
ncbi:heterokaryon incompatibility protein-domain-containing protein [Lophiotrema nucula]|uniref:Heterokaryon incompatibility protein-domain-containing protein n=1 Tax=Lophiotrema nucula TaxID=690887 RepID=A0A6A5YVZ2_9PLEO|nr:heterokaryon incompatibility protein-domain-containing protein [Lophiotrema nucula]